MDIIEGFYCPICLRDMVNVSQLEKHFRDEHKSIITDGKRPGAMRNLIGKAKVKISEFESKVDSALDASLDDGKSPVRQSGRTGEPRVSQETGVTRSRTAYFSSARGVRIDFYVKEINKLTVRLEKLTAPDSHSSGISLDNLNKKSLANVINQRKKFEKSVVTWVSDDAVPLCPSCGSKFNVLRAKHHCRLCGSVVCDPCSLAIPFSVARKLINSEREAASGSSESLKRKIAGIFPILRDTPLLDEPTLRSCPECYKLLCKKHIQQEESLTNSPLLEIYSKLKEAMVEVENCIPTYMKMVESINAFDPTVSLDEAMDLRIRLLRLYDVIDSRSKSIATFGSSETVEDVSVSHTTNAVRCQRNVRNAATAFLQNNLFALESLPTPQQYEVAKEQFENQTTFVPSNPRNMESSRNLEKHPIQLQIGIIKGYLEQARKANKADEIKMLQSNLLDLEMELIKLQ